MKPAGIVQVPICSLSSAKRTHCSKDPTPQISVSTSEVVGHESCNHARSHVVLPEDSLNVRSGRVGAASEAADDAKLKRSPAGVGMTEERLALHRVAAGRPDPLVRLGGLKGNRLQELQSAVLIRVRHIQGPINDSVSPQPASFLPRAMAKEQPLCDTTTACRRIVGSPRPIHTAHFHGPDGARPCGRQAARSPLRAPHPSPHRARLGGERGDCGRCFVAVRQQGTEASSVARAGVAAAAL